jgi:glycosyltransferase involved in cell wall biosynthesis
VNTTAVRICLVGLKSYDQITANAVPRYLGGIETQLAALAKGLAIEGCEVSLITYDHGQDDGERVDGVTVFKSYAPTAGIRGLRSIHPRSTQLWQAMRRANADIYIQMGAGAETGQVAVGCRLLGPRRRKFVFCMASDANFGRHLEAGVEGRVYGYGLRRANRIIAQTVHQKNGLQQATGLPSEVIPMMAEPPFCASTVQRRPPLARVLWVGRIMRDKRLEWLLEVARQAPGVAFDVVGTPNRASEYASALLADAAALPNVRVHGRVSGEELAALYRQTAVVCCTSALEGFPTTFLEAWSCGIPVLTTFDPDGVVARHGLGRVAVDPKSLVLELHAMLGSPSCYSALSTSATNYYLANHARQTVSRRFRHMLEDVIATE